MKTILINTICICAAILILAWAYWSKKHREIAALNEQTRLLKLDTARLNAQTARLVAESINSVEDTYGDKQQIAKRRRDLHQEAMKRIPDNIVLPQVQSTPYDDNLLEGLLASPINYPPADTHIVNSPFHSRPSTSDRGVLEAGDTGRSDSSHHGSYKDHGTHSYTSTPESTHSTSHSSYDSSSHTSSSSGYDSSSSSSDTSSSDSGSSSSSSD